jgi:hypothetical protein
MEGIVVGAEGTGVGARVGEREGVWVGVILGTTVGCITEEVGSRNTVLTRVLEGTIPVKGTIDADQRRSRAVDAT